MKKVFDNHMVAHVWAQRTQDEGRSHNGNFSFRGDTIYSYWTPIARLVDTATGAVALVTCETFSMTTSCKHMNPVRRALRGDMPVFYVPFIASGGRGAGSMIRHEGESEIAAANLKHIEDSYYNERQRLSRTRERCNYGIERLRELYATRVQFALAFELAYTSRDVDADIAELESRWARLEAKANDPAQVAKREREAQRRAEREIENLADKVKTWRESFDAWRNGGQIARHPYDSLTWRKRRNMPPLEEPGIMLRVRGDLVETSRHASVPVEHAKRLWRFIKSCHDSKTAWQANGHTIALGHFKADRIDANGDLHAGCHHIAFAELQRMAFTLGLELQEVAQRGALEVIA